MSERCRFPAEWESQSAVLIAWPHPETDWGPRLVEVEETYIALVAAITAFENAVICIADDDLQTYAEARLRSARVDMERVRFVTVEYDDTWLRDSGPISLVCETGGFRLLDFRFTGWGGKFEAGRDDRLVEALFAQGVFANAQREQIDFALEGGGIETDGAGIVCCGWIAAIWKATTPTRTSTPSPASPPRMRSSIRAATRSAIRITRNCRRWPRNWRHCAPATAAPTASSPCPGRSPCSTTAAGWPPATPTS
jgi:agmatine/peptidylarginine deiminase